MAFDAAGTLWTLKTETAPELYRLDPSDASVLEMVPVSGFPPGITLGGMEFDDATDTLYVVMDGVLAIVDPTTGASTVIGPTPVEQALEVIGPCGPPVAGPPPVPAFGPLGRGLLTVTLLALATWFGATGRRRSV